MIRDYTACDKRDINLMAIMKQVDSAIIANSSTAIQNILDINCPKLFKHFNCIETFYKNITFCYEKAYFDKMNTQNKFFLQLLHYICDSDGKNLMGWLKL